MITSDVLKRIRSAGASGTDDARRRSSAGLAAMLKDNVPDAIMDEVLAWLAPIFE
jgi:hypothetical protein